MKGSKNGEHWETSSAAVKGLKPTTNRQKGGGRLPEREQCICFHVNRDKKLKKKQRFREDSDEDCQQQINYE